MNIKKLTLLFAWKLIKAFKNSDFFSNFETNVTTWAYIMKKYVLHFLSMESTKPKS